ncbi:MAG: hypothetical protein LR001_07815 [Clostridiales bacterium]|nr:hypothetical protein [Clostridiales bacterium]
MIKSSYKYILTELKHHAPFTIISTIVSLVLFGVIARLFLQGHEHTHNNTIGMLFHTMHPLHILFSATATTAMFWRHEKNLIKAIAVGLGGSLLICAAGDIVFPYFGGLLMGTNPELHLCILKHPETILPFAILGVLIGIIAVNKITGRRVSIFSHSAHVFVSIFATMFYLTSFGGVDFLSYPIQTFIIISFSVVIPCCISDIVFPLLIQKNKMLKTHNNCCH